MLFTSFGPKLGRWSAGVYTYAVLAALFAGMSPAQSTFGEFLGTVHDPSGAVVAGCTITVKNLGTSATRTATSDSNGTYTVVNLEPANYEITFRLRAQAPVNNLELKLIDATGDNVWWLNRRDFTFPTTTCR